MDDGLEKLKQMHDIEAVDPLDPSRVTDDMQAKALNYLMFLKQKCTSAVKGYGCANRRIPKVYVKEGRYCSTNHRTSTSANHILHTG